MLRRIFVFSLLAALAFAAAPAEAQDEPGCFQSDPYTLEVTVDENGFSGDREWTITHGDWYKIVVANLDIGFRHHNVTIDDLGFRLHAAPLEEAESEPLLFDRTGQFALADEPTGDVAWIAVTEFDATEVDNSTSTGSPATTTGATGGADGDADAPGLPVLLVACAALAMAGLRRR